MSWIHDRLRERQQNTERTATIRAYATDLYDALWQAIYAYVEEAKGLGMPLFTNGAHLARIVKMSVNPRPTEQGRRADEFKLTLNERAAC